MSPKTVFDKIVLATSNIGKVKEFTLLSPDLPWKILPQSDFQVSPIEETGLTFLENALIKSRHASRQTGLPAIGDDSGIIVDALDGAPGLYSARYAGINATADQHMAKLLTEMNAVPLEQRTARFYCVLVLLHHFDDSLPIIAESYWEGSILLQPQGQQGFGYDPIFYVPTHQCSAAELPVLEKMKICHRGQAWRNLVKQFK